MLLTTSVIWALLQFNSMSIRKVQEGKAYTQPRRIEGLSSASLAFSIQSGNASRRGIPVYQS